jgi:hypothetical protein
MSGDVGIYQREDGLIYVHSNSRVMSGPLVANGWAMVVPGDASDEQLGQVVVEGLDRTEMDIPEPTRGELDRLMRPLYKLASVRSYSRFVSGARYVGVGRDVAGAITVIPSKNQGGRRGFGYLPERSRELKAPFRMGDVGRLVREGLESAVV